MLSPAEAAFHSVPTFHPTLAGGFWEPEADRTDFGSAFDRPAELPCETRDSPMTSAGKDTAGQKKTNERHRESRVFLYGRRSAEHPTRRFGAGGGRELCISIRQQAVARRRLAFAADGLQRTRIRYVSETHQKRSISAAAAVCNASLNANRLQLHPCAASSSNVDGRNGRTNGIKRQ